MGEFLVNRYSLPEAYHQALMTLYNFGNVVPCPDWNTEQKEVSMTMVVQNPLAEPLISKCFIGGPKDLEQYRQEMVDGILDFEVDKGNWKYTYHDRMVNYSIDNQIKFPNQPTINQIQFVIDELKRNPDSRRAVIDIRDNSDDIYSDDPACLQHIQYFIRNGKLDCKVLFRSNDACKASFMNAFALIMLQKKIADELGVEIGIYTHRANSFHCYARDYDLLKGYVKRIMNSTKSEISYNYIDEWEILMDEAKEEIAANVNKLKGN